MSATPSTADVSRDALSPQSLSDGFSGALSAERGYSSESSNGLAASLRRILRPDQILTRPIERIAYAHDASCYRLVPQAVARPETLGDVRHLMEWSAQSGVGLTFRAAGTSLSGQAVTNGVIVDLTRGAWDSFLALDEGKRVRVGPGIVGAKVNERLRAFGRKIGPDPASLTACMIGGIVANNASGMCCGVQQNTYHTLESMKFLLPNGVFVDSALPDADARLKADAPEIYDGILALKAETEQSEALAQKIRRKYKIKNTIGYSLNALLDFDAPVEILTHLMVGSEGTLGFIAEAGFFTVPDLPLKATALLFFASVADACGSIVPLRDSGAAALELMDYASLAAMREEYGAPKEIIDALPPTGACLLAEYQAADREKLEALRAAGEALLPSLPLVATLPFTEDAKTQALFWKLRKGLIPVVSAKRRPGTTVINEDIAFPIEYLAEGVTALQELFVKHRYPDGVVFGHAKDGNLHFTLAQAFDSEADVAQFEGLLRDVADLVVGRFDGSLKAEHGTGRNMAPFVEMEWGKEAYDIMRRLKKLIDPLNILNPGVILNDNPKVHIENLKPIPQVEKEVDACIECGWCENKCPSQGLTLTPRQRIVVRREITRLRARHNSDAERGRAFVPDAASPFAAWQLERDYEYYGLETCATDGMCATVCPVHINTGDLVKVLRAERHSDFAKDNAQTLARNFGVAVAAAKFGVKVAKALEKAGARGAIDFALDVAESLTGARLPNWNPQLGSPIELPSASADNADAVYFPACVTHIMGGAPDTPDNNDNATNGKKKKSQKKIELKKKTTSKKKAEQESAAPDSADAVRALLAVAERAGKRLLIPPESASYCCGTPFSSKGYDEAYRAMLRRTIDMFWSASDGGRLPILTDASSCVYTFRNAAADLDGEALERFGKLTILDVVEYTADTLLPILRERGLLQTLPESVVLHPVCSILKLGYADKLHAVAAACAREATTPIDAGCCGFAGDRGMIVPELTANATALEAREIRERPYDGYYSSNPTCQIGMTEAVGAQYESFILLVERASRPQKLLES
jgi:D-lactate dehydrogenase